MARKEINVMTGEVTEHADDAPVIHVQTPQEKRAYEYPTIGDQLDDYRQARPESYLWDTLPCLRELTSTLHESDIADIGKKKRRQHKN